MFTQLTAFGSTLPMTTWDRTQTIIERFADRYEPNIVALDGTRDNKIVEDIERAGYQVDLIRFSSRKKQTLIENLITELETGRITVPSSANTLLNELEMYEFERKESGQVSYSAPSGLHDDCVDALALAVSASSPTPKTIPSTF